MSTANRLLLAGFAALALGVVLLIKIPPLVEDLETEDPLADRPNVHIIYVALEDCPGRCGDAPRIESVFPYLDPRTFATGAHYFGMVPRGVVYSNKMRLKWSNYSVSTGGYAFPESGWNTRLEVCKIDQTGSDYQCQVSEGRRPHKIRLIIGPVWIAWVGRIMPIALVGGIVLVLGAAISAAGKRQQSG